MKSTKVQNPRRSTRIYMWKNAPVIAHKTARARIACKIYAHAYNCMLADTNGGLLRGKQKTLYLYNGTVLRKMQHLKTCPRIALRLLVSLFGYIVAYDCRLAGTDRQTHTQRHTQTNYSNPRCACAPRVHYANL